MNSATEQPRATLAIPTAVPVARTEAVNVVHIQVPQGGRSPSGRLECRICQAEETREEPFLYPCNCRGSLSAIHQECLEKWIQERTNQMLNSNDPDFIDFDTALKCEICHSTYNVRVERKFILDRQAACSCEAWRHYCDFFMLLLVAFCSGFASFMVLRNEWQDGGSSSARYLIIAFTVICGLLFACTAIRIVQRWRKANTVQHILPMHNGAPQTVHAYNTGAETAIIA
eukprot:GILJ01016771.1.p1 GENE.GILJ01016771.1~~GILJ01016771.1.p1  ORF type:complete len:229 (-),score=20.96 GILJ01016771.1:365-1051(-)